VTTLEEGVGPDAEGTGGGQTRTEEASPQAPRGWRAAAPDLPGLVRRNWIFAVALGVAVLPRLVAIIAFQPAVLFRLDTYDYLWGAVHLSPNVVNPSGYSVFLWLLRPFHSLVLVAALQHLIGLGIATMVYALARRYGLPDWGATLAAAPVLFDPAQILVEQFVMADLLAIALIAGAFTILLLRRPPSLQRVITAGLTRPPASRAAPAGMPPRCGFARRRFPRRPGRRLLRASSLLIFPRHHRNVAEHCHDKSSLPAGRGPGPGMSRAIPPHRCRDHAPSRKSRTRCR